VFYWDIVHDDVYGVDVSNCESMNVIVRYMLNIDLRKSEGASEWSFVVRCVERG
jgi:hypothetical protein